MDGWQETKIQSVLCAKNEEEVFDALFQATKSLGFERCAYGLRVPLPISNPKVSMLNNYPATWQQQYAQQNYLACDPTVTHALRSPAPCCGPKKFSPHAAHSGKKHVHTDCKSAGPSHATVPMALWDWSRCRDRMMKSLPRSTKATPWECTGWRNLHTRE